MSMIALPPAVLIRRQVADALAEDIGPADYTAQLIPADRQGHASVLMREEGIVCGQAWFAECFAQLDPAIQITWRVAEGAEVAANTILCTLDGPARPILTGERCALNFLQTLSATATTTRDFVAAIAGTRAKIHDTRKTLPGLRLAQKYAVRIGGGENQRVGLYDGILIKENHLIAAGGIANALAAARTVAPAGVGIQIEVETLSELQQAITAGATSILLDNMSLAQMCEAVRISNGRAVLEASGGVDLSTVREIAETGVDRISVGRLTKDVLAIDLSLRFAFVTV